MKNLTLPRIAVQVDLIPTVEQHCTLSKWVGASRYVYNAMLAICSSAYQHFNPEKIKPKKTEEELKAEKEAHQKSLQEKAKQKWKNKGKGKGKQKKPNQAKTKPKKAKSDPKTKDEPKIEWREPDKNFLTLLPHITMLLEEEKAYALNNVMKQIEALSVTSGKEFDKLHEKRMAIETKPVGKFFNPSSYEFLCLILTQLKRIEEASFLNDVPHHCLQRVVKNLAQAFNNFFKHGKGYPRFKLKRKSNLTVSFARCNKSQLWYKHKQDGQIQLQSLNLAQALGGVIFNHRHLGETGRYKQLQTDYTLKSVTVKAGAKKQFSALDKNDAEMMRTARKAPYGWTAVLLFEANTPRTQSITADKLLATLPTIKMLKLTNDSDQTKTKSLGIDVGFNHYLNLSQAVDGSHFHDLPSILPNRLQALPRLQRRLAKNRLNTTPDKSHKVLRKGETHKYSTEQRRQNGISLGYASHLLKHRQMHHKIKAEFQRYHYDLAYRLFAEHDLIFYEDLDLMGISKSAKGTAEEHGTNVKQKSALNRQWRDGRYGEFYQILHRVANKLRMEGKEKFALPVNNRYTSQHCLRCGTTDSQSRHGTTFKCTRCGHEAHADINAALNIEALGMATYFPKTEIPLAGERQTLQ